MKWKRGTSYVGLRLPMRKVLVEGERIWRALGRELVVTSAVDGQHSAGSLHYYGLGLDLRTWWWSDAEAEDAACRLRQALGPEYYVQYEPAIWRHGKRKRGAHIHVDYRGRRTGWLEAFLPSPPGA